MIILFQLEVVINISEPKASIVKLVSIWARLRRTMICGAQPPETDTVQRLLFLKPIQKTHGPQVWMGTSHCGLHKKDVSTGTLH